MSSDDCTFGLWALRVGYRDMELFIDGLGDAALADPPAADRPWRVGRLPVLQGRLRP